ncbi:tektin-2-like isoform X1 [Acipenser ruthenus]|uniref:tektin-2-like isoform X1 n=1 Tax=Acipenser ruthenus TaxID=7906 RepID=UPI002741393E|nr:tektin-2-like isoform X1 [Acipenser ruthenus]
MLIPSVCVCMFLSLDRSVRMRRSPQSGVWSLTGSTYLSINRDSSTKARRWQVQHGLTDEVQQLEGTMTALKQKRAQSQDVLHALSQQLTRIEEDIACKTSSLSLERRSLDTRSKLIVPPEKHVPETDTFNRTLSPVKSRQLELA